MSTSQLDETWKDVTGYDGRYRVSSHGRVVSTDYRGRGREKELRVQRPATYPLVALFGNGARQQIGINRLVALHFLAPADDARKTAVVPRDGNRLNLRWDNLAWADPAEAEDQEMAARLHKSGTAHYRTKLPAEPLAEGGTHRAVAERYGVTRAAVTMAAKRARAK